MDARFTQPRTDAHSFDPAIPAAAPAPFHSCIFHDCKIRFFGNALEGAVRAKKKGSPSPRLASLSLLTHGHRAGGRIRDYPSQKDPIPEVTLQRVPLNCSSSRNQEQPACPCPTPASCRGSASSRNGPTPRPTLLAVGAAKSRPQRGPDALETSCLPLIRARPARSFLAHARCTSSGHDPIIDPITSHNSWGVPSFPGRT